jgi:hypothetical protein
MAEKKEKLVKMKLKLRKRHPKKKFRLGEHVIEPQLKEFELSEANVLELQSKGCKAWIISEDEIKEAKKDKEKKPVK